MSRIKLLIVDDSVVVRRMLSEALSAEPKIEVLATAANGRIALSKLEKTPADIVVLDVDMPEMNGLETLARIRKLYSKTRVIMFSSLTERGADATLEALFLGATDYVTKPSGGKEAALEAVNGRLIPKILALFPSAASAPAPIKPSQSIKEARPAAGPLSIVAIGASTGGPNALEKVLKPLPANFPMPILIVQHMPPMFTRYLAQQLDAKCAISVREATDGAVVEPGLAWIAPGDHHMTIKRHEKRIVISTDQEPPENSCRPSVDVLFRSVDKLFGSKTLGVVLTGMGRDGTRGCENIRRSGGHVVVQNESSSVVWGMPGQIVKEGFANQCLNVDQIGREILSLSRNGARR